MNKIITYVYTWLTTAGYKFGKTKKELAISLIQEEFDELKNAKTINEEIDAIIDLFWVILNYAFFVGISKEKLLEIEDEVKVSNFSKFCLTQTEALATIKAYSTGTHPDKKGICINTYYDKVEYDNTIFYVVERLEDNKTLKSINYKPVTSL